MIPPEIPQLFVHPSSGPDRDLVYVPALLGRGRVYFHDRRAGIEEERMVCVMVPLTDGTRSIDWTTGEERELTDADLSEQPAGKASYGALPALVGKLKTFETWKKSFGDWLYRGQKIELWKCAPLKLCSMPGESERDFRARLQQVVREQRDQAVEKIRQKNATKLSSLTDKIRRARETVNRETIQATEQKAQTAISFGSAILGALFGRKAISTTTLSKAATTARGVGRSMKESTDIDRAKANVVALEQQLNELETKLEAEIAAIAKQGENGLEPFESIAVKPKRADVSVELVAIAWLAD